MNGIAVTSGGSGVGGVNEMKIDLIDRMELLEFARLHTDGRIDCNDIARFPATDAEPVRHGRWIPCGNDPFDAGMFYCSTCENLRYFDEEILTSKEAEKCAYYCPNCGAKMDLKE